MIKNQWYAVLSSDSVRKGKICAARRFGEELLFFRDKEGRAGCVSSLCAHRGADLGKGCIKDGNISCPFHGIEYDVDGKCIYVPSDGRASDLDHSRFDLKRYPLREIGGIVFIWYGDREPDSEPVCFDIITDPSFVYSHMDDEWGVDYSRVIENQLDVSHLAFVHRTTIGRGNKTLCNGPKVEWIDPLTLRTSADNEVDTGQKPGTADESNIKSTNLNFKFPNMWLNHVTDKIQILAYFVPVDDEHSIISLRFYNKITGVNLIDRMIAALGSAANKVIERQDKRIVETQLPKKSGLKIGENLAQADLPIVEYRAKRKALQDGDPVLHPAGKVKGVPVMDTKAMYRLSYGLFICTVKQGEKANGCIINTAVQVASEPNRISVAVNKANYTHELLRQTGICNISVISRDAGFELFKRFGFQSGREVDKFADFSKNSYELAANGIPYITEGTNAYFSLKVEKEMDLGSHTLFICEPVFMTVLSDSPSCTYEYYQENIKPKPEKVGKTPDGETVWRCVVCGYEYVGEKLPDDFICPVCKHPKADFEKVGSGG